MANILVLQGVPASGKTTWAKEFVKKNPKYIRVSRDDLRNMRGKYWEPSQENLITKYEYFAVYTALADGYNVLIDATNLNQRTIDNWNKLATEFKAEIEFKLFTVSLEEAIKRDSSRENPVGEGTIRKFYNLYRYAFTANTSQLPTLAEKIEQNPHLPKAIICDLDGTLCLHNGRNPYEEDKCDTDLVNIPIREILRMYRLSSTQKRTVLFVSGRKDTVEEKTKLWLVENAWVPFELFMRKANDNRKDYIVKKEIFDTHIKDNYYIDFVLDDRDQVVKLWRDMGLTCLQVNYGNF
jgi:predicted kinase